MSALNSMSGALLFALIVVTALSGCTRNNPGSLICEHEPIRLAPTPSSAYRGETISHLESLVGDGDMAAARVLGERYQSGDGVPVDLKQAADWYTAAAIIPPTRTFIAAPAVGRSPGFLVPASGGGGRPGDPIAMAELGRLYLTGHGVSADPARAQVLLSCAATYRIAHGSGFERLGSAWNG